MRLTTICALSALGLAICAAGKTVRINVGGRALDGYSADTKRGFFAKGPGKETVYSSHALGPRMKPLTYVINVPDRGLYTVRLQFAENYIGTSRPGARILNVDINGARVASGLDVFVRAGRRRFAPYDIVRSDVRARGGRIVVRISATRQNAMLSGIVVEPQDPAATKSSRPTRADRSNPSRPDRPTRPERPSTPSRPTRPDRPSNRPTRPGSWDMIKTAGHTDPVARHESCAVMVAGKIYIIGGRGVKPVSVFDPSTKRWANRRGPGIEIHHFQCVAYKNRFIYIAGAWTGRYPREQALDSVRVYDVVTGQWRVEAQSGLGKRARGGGALVLHNDRLYLAMGNRGGHGPHATTLGELDMYNPATKKWTALPSAPDGRDHVGGGVVNGKLCIAGGRDGGAKDFFQKVITRVNCYDFKTRRWSRGANLPEGRAGAATGVTCDGFLMIAGGEGVPAGKRGIAFKRVDLYDAANDKFLEPSRLGRGRHGSGLAISDCKCGNIYLPSGSGGLGGAPELKTTEVWAGNGKPKSGC